jgi:GTP pyrophosphokinase
MSYKARKFDEIYDVFALRIIVDNVSDCYKTLGIIHSLWRPKPNRFKDYIAVPKPNGYQSLHTTVFGPQGKATEFQIRTKEMNDKALYGIAAHWHYKQIESDRSSGDNQPSWIKEILEAQRELGNTDDFLNKVKLDVFQDKIFVFSPKGDVFELPSDSTPIDFAYAVHTDIGNKASGALVNDKMSSLDHGLKNGDLVEIIVDKNKKGPSYDWIKFVKTKRARDKIKQNATRGTFIKKFMPGK